MSKTAVVFAQQRWEYTFFARKSEPALVNELNVLGLEGWEMVHLEYHKDPKGVMTWTAFLRRPYAGAGPSPSRPAQTASQTAPSDEADAGRHQGFDLSGDVFEIQKE
jgi:hypothetical protein